MANRAGREDFKVLVEQIKKLQDDKEKMYKTLSTLEIRRYNKY